MPLHTLTEPTTRVDRDPRQAEKLVHAAGEQRQAQAFEPTCAVTISIPVGIAISKLAALKLVVKAALELPKTGARQEHLE